MIGDARYDLAQVGFGIDAVQLCRLCRAPDYAEPLHPAVGDGGFRGSLPGIVLLSSLCGSTEEAEMTTSAYFRNEKSLRRIHEGPLGIYVDQYAARMTVDGYGRQSGWYCLGLVSDFS